MRIFLLILMLTLGRLQLLAASRITVEQLKSMVPAAHGEPDADVAREIAGLELVERLSSAQLRQLRAGLPGERSRDALLVLADGSAFLDPPPSQIVSLETPDLASQQQMIGLTLNYVTKTFHELPNFYATRVTTTFRRELWSDKPLRRVSRYSDVEVYRDGKLRLHTSRPHVRSAGLTTSGEFGPILATAVLDAARGNLNWSRWEKGDEGLEAVYRYAVSAKDSHYVVQDQVSAYRGEIAIDPSSGAILRIVLIADPGHANPLAHADMVVEYGLVELGGRKYICPVRAIALSDDSQLMWLNDVAFEEYHLFRPEMRILPGVNEAH